MKYYTIYNTETGLIKRIGCCADVDYNIQTKNTENIIEGIFPSDKYYVVNNIPILKTEFEDVSDRQISINSATTFINLPNPTLIYIENNLQTTTDGIFEISFNYEGTYYLIFKSVSKYDKEIKIEVST